MSTLQGSASAVLVRTETGFDSQSGVYTQYVWEGTEDAIIAARAGLAGATSYVQSPAGGGKWQLSARFGNAILDDEAEKPSREERLRFNITQKSIFTNPYLTAGMQSYAIKAVRNALDTVVSETSISAWNPEQQRLYGLAIAGVDSYPVYQPIVVITDTASYDYNWSANFANYGLTYSTKEMIKDARLSSGWRSGLPDGVSDLSGFLFGWLKKPPEIVSVGGNRTQLVQEYEYGLWSEDLLPRY